MRARRSSFSPRRPRKAERAFRVHTGRNVWLWLKVERSFRVSKSQLSFGVPLVYKGVVASPNGRFSDFNARVLQKKHHFSRFWRRYES